jgi:hypothetical protein
LASRGARPIAGRKSGRLGRSPIQRLSSAPPTPGKIVLEVLHQQVGAMPRRRLVRRRELDGAGDAQALLHRRDEEAALGRD